MKIFKKQHSPIVLPSKKALIVIDKTGYPPDADSEPSGLELDVRTLHEIGDGASGALALEALLPQIIETIAGLSQLQLFQQRGGIFSVEGEELKLLYYLGDLDRRQEFTEQHQGLKWAGSASAAAPDSGPEERRASLAGAGRHRHIQVPLKIDGQVVAVMALCLLPDAQLTAHQDDLLCLAGDQLGRAIEQAQRYQLEKKARVKAESDADRLALLNEITLSLHRASDRQFIARLLLSGAAELTGAGLATLTTLSRGRIEETFVFAPRAVNPALTLPEDWTIDAAALTEALSLLKQKPVVSGSGQNLHSWLPQYFLLTESILLGAAYDQQREIEAVLLLGHKQDGGQFNAADEEFLSLLLAQGACATANAKNLADQSRTAESLRAALMPDTPEKTGIDLGLVHLAADREKASAGSDFYDFVEMDENRLAIVIGGVGGKGLPAAQYVAMTKYTLRALLKEGNDPGQCLTKANQVIFAEKQANGFVTACLLIIDLEKKIVTFANAGHLLPLVVKAGGAARQASRSLNSEKFVPLGVLSQQEFPTVQVTMEAMSSFVLFSNGLSEARDSSHQVFGRQGIADAIAGQGSWSAQELADRIIKNCQEFTGGQPHADAILIVISLVKQQAGAEWRGAGI